ncbi:RDD family protein [Longirhabdus pacifica]|uniref:RDD family protein n=1 Tax=Longirhabdus pacifica TaxID=2305227 RepID=UPI0010089C01|nr:RDD family protein [Longirhabdus pacifica]
MEINNPAGFLIRFGANLLDTIIIFFPLSFIFTGSLWEDNWYSSTLSMLYSFFVPIIWYGYTVGKRMAGIRILKTDGSKVTFITMLLRLVVAAIVYGITLGIGFIVSAIMVVVRDDRRSLHDFIAGTYVTYDKP